MNREKSQLKLKEISIKITKDEIFTIDKFIQRSGLMIGIKVKKQKDAVYRAVTDWLKILCDQEYIKRLENEKRHARGRPAKIYQALANMSIVVNPNVQKYHLPCGHEVTSESRPKYCQDCGRMT